MQWLYFVLKKRKLNYYKERNYKTFSCKTIKTFPDRDEMTHRVTRAADNTKQSDMGLSTMSLKQATDSMNRYCTCNENICNCCRDFHIPVVQLKGPGNYRAMQLCWAKNESVAET